MVLKVCHAYIHIYIYIWHPAGTLPRDMKLLAMHMPSCWVFPARHEVATGVCCTPCMKGHIQRLLSLNMFEPNIAYYYIDSDR